MNCNKSLNLNELKEVSCKNEIQSICHDARRNKNVKCVINI